MYLRDGIVNFRVTFEGRRANNCHTMLNLILRQGAGLSSETVHSDYNLYKLCQLLSLP